jgi:hypothetical protein
VPEPLAALAVVVRAVVVRAVGLPPVVDLVAEVLAAEAALELPAAVVAAYPV